ncbi:hypothetical protein ABT301_23920 [Streptomyces sp. NPDC000987]|uniref:Rv1733c family protein n=1 Tax=Streptomyces sp. NPDC000987 TaxID=3154374 RepID=UPI0033212A98
MKKARPTRSAKVRFWRWRRNPLRRHSDRVEAWTVLAAWLLALLAALCTGLAVGGWVTDGLAARRANTHPVSAVLTDDVPSAPAMTGYGSDGTVWARVRWTGADGATRTDRVKVDPGEPAGTRVTVWLDRTGTPVTQPPGVTEARVQAALLGVPAALGAGALVLGGGRLACGRLDRRRYEEWAAEWERIGPQWRKRMLG